MIINVKMFFVAYYCEIVFFLLNESLTILFYFCDKSIIV